MSFDHGFEVRVLYLLKSVWQSLAQGYYLNFAIFLLNSTLQEVVKLLKLNHFLKKALRSILKTTALVHFFLCYQKLLKGCFMNKQRSFWVRTKFSTCFNRVFENTTLQTLALDISLIKLLPDSKKAFSLEWMILIHLQNAFDTRNFSNDILKRLYNTWSK